MGDEARHGRDSSDARVLGTVRRLLARELREQGDGAGDAVRLLSLDAGDGRDALPVLAGSPATVRATLVEPDPDLAAAARATARELRLDVSVRCAEAGTTAAYLRVLPVDVLLIGGVLGDVAEAELATTVAALPGLLAHEALVLWWVVGGDAGHAVAAAFLDGPFEEVELVDPEDADVRVGAHRFTGAPEGAAPGTRLFDLG